MQHSLGEAGVLGEGVLVRVEESVLTYRVHRGHRVEESVLT